jgi:acetyltransferase-like isoleucine patch superfamily enzyme
MAKLQDPLAGTGLQIKQFATGIPRRLNPDSLFEAPIAFSAAFAVDRFIAVGAFTLANGGQFAHVEIGRYCSIAAGVTIGASEHPLDRITSSTITVGDDFQGWSAWLESQGRKGRLKTAKPSRPLRPRTTIGHDVWIGAGAFIKAGCRIGTGAVVGAGSVVVSDVAPYAIVAGAPARMIRMRFPEAVVSDLLALEWWRYSLYDLDSGFGAVDAPMEELKRRIAGGSIQPYAPEPWTGAKLLSLHI